MLIVESIRYQQESNPAERDQIIPDNGLSGHCYKVLVEFAEIWGSPPSPGATSDASGASQSGAQRQSRGTGSSQPLIPVGS